MRFIRWWPSLSIRLLLCFIFISWGTILFTHSTMQRILTKELPHYELQTLTRDADELANKLEDSYNRNGSLSISMLDTIPPHSYRLFRVDGEEMEANSPWPSRRDLVTQTLEGRILKPESLTTDDNRRYGYQVLPLEHNGKIIGAIEVATELPPVERFIQAVQYDFAIAGFVAVGSVLAVGLYLTGYFRRSLNEIKLQTEAIVSGDFDRRIPVGPKDEMGQIATYLNQMAEDLQRLAQTRNEFFSKVSHELRTPLTVAKGFTSLLRKGEMLPSQERTVKIIDDQIEDLTRLVNDLLDLSRRQHSSMDLRTNDIDCGELIAEVFEQQRPVMRSQKVTLEVYYKQRHVPIKGDRQRLNQVLGNLLTNAARYCRGRVWLELDTDQQYAIIRVSDNGPGIAPEDQPRIFEPFFQAKKGPRGRAGLGLTVARELVLGHGGEISVNSMLGEGTTFTIALPRTDVASSEERKTWGRFLTLRPRKKRAPAAADNTPSETQHA